MPYTTPTPSTVSAGDTFPATAYNIISADIQDHESRIKTGVESYTTAQKNALSGVATGTQIYDSTLGYMQQWNGAAWVFLDGSPPRLTTAQRDALTGVGTGTMIYNSTTNVVETYTGSVWNPVSPLRTVVKNRVAVNSTGSSWSNPTSFTEIPQADDRAALNTSFVKVGGTGTNLVISVSGSVLFTSGLSQVFTWGVRVAATSYSVSAILLVVSPVRTFWGGTTTITGLAAGTYSIDPMLKTAAASAAALQAYNDTVSISITETLA